MENLSFLLSYSFVALVLLYSYRENLQLEKDILIASGRAFLQLLLLGFSLHYIFSLESLLSIGSVLLGMLLFASYEAHRRVGGFRNALLSIATSSTVVIASLLLFGIIEPNSRELIPIGGMLIGNSLNNYTIGVERIDREIELSKDRIEAYVAVGSTYKEATHHLKVHSIKASLIPVLNSLRTVGIVLIPGITTGMIIAGADPLSATTFQIVVMYMILSVALITSIVGLSLRVQSSDLQPKPRQ